MNVGLLSSLYAAFEQNKKSRCAVLFCNRRIWDLFVKRLLLIPSEEKRSHFLKSFMGNFQIVPFSSATEEIEISEKTPKSKR